MHMDDLRPFEPDSATPWDRAAAAHLLRRMGFTPNMEEVDRALLDGVPATVDRFVDAEGDSGPHDELDELGERLAARNDINALRGWWLLRMCRTERPLHARLSVFWHSHFATSNQKVSSAMLMYEQLRLFEAHGLGGFEDLLLAISRDPAMIIWLDGNDNAKGRPNENYARELFELFGLGVGNYTESDIKEAARAFTGWHQRDGRFRYFPLEHDEGEKEVFGRRGNWEGEEIVRFVIEHEACAPFVATKLLREFLTAEPSPALVDALASRLRETGYDVREALRTLFKSRAMFDPRCRRARIKSPVEYVVGMSRSLGVEVPASALADSVASMGQRLFEPPSVKGWDGHRAWLNSTTMLVRLNAASAAAERAAPVLAQRGFADAPDAREFCLDLCLDGAMPESLESVVSSIDESTMSETIQRTLEAILASPEYQMG
jgi:uncharacterized protein (DUF1800 family)